MKNSSIQSCRIGSNQELCLTGHSPFFSTSSIGSIRKLMLSWIKHFMESIVPFGDSAKKAVTFVFKYLNCLKGKLLI
jgi:hypothetical protein